MDGWAILGYEIKSMGCKKKTGKLNCVKLKYLTKIITKNVKRTLLCVIFLSVCVHARVCVSVCVCVCLCACMSHTICVEVREQRESILFLFDWVLRIEFRSGHYVWQQELLPPKPSHRPMEQYRKYLSREKSSNIWKMLNITNHQRNEAGITMR